MAYVWSKDLETGNPMIDAQHKELFAAFNQFLDACNQGKGKDEILKTMDFLINYTTKHFADEQRLQMQHKYPEYNEHKKLHDDFKKTVVELAEQLKKDGASISLVSKVSTTVGTWLRNHIKKEDKKVADHIKSKQ